MTRKSNSDVTVLYIPHGGGPLPLLGHPGHRELVDFLTAIPGQFERPEVIVVISAHWEQSIPTLTANASPPLIYDYYGFAPEAYEIEYPAPGHPQLSKELYAGLEAAGIHSQLEDRWGFDHGMYIPLKLMYPEARIPCVQISLMNGLDPLAHISLGQALSGMLTGKILVLGSGFSFHNMKTFGETGTDLKNVEFDQWLSETMTDTGLTASERVGRLVRWEEAPHARYCHPTEEHLLPLHVCCGIAGAPAERVFDGHILGKKSAAFLWKN